MYNMRWKGEEFELDDVSANLDAVYYRDGKANGALMLGGEDSEEDEDSDVKEECMENMKE